MAATARLTASRRSSCHVALALEIAAARRESAESARQAQRIALAEVRRASLRAASSRSRGRWMSAAELAELGVRRRSRRPPRALCRARCVVPTKSIVARSPSGASSATRGARVLCRRASISPVSALSSTARFDRLQQPRVGRHGVARFELEDIADDDARARRRSLHVVAAAHARVRRLHLLERVERGLGAPLLIEAEHRVQDDDEQDRDRVAVPRERRSPAGCRPFTMAMTAATSSVNTIGFANCARIRLSALLLFGLGSSFGPSSASLLARLCLSGRAPDRPPARSRSCSTASAWTRLAPRCSPQHGAGLSRPPLASAVGHRGRALRACCCSAPPSPRARRPARPARPSTAAAGARGGRLDARLHRRGRASAPRAGASPSCA